jgi:hypothetical protein
MKKKFSWRAFISFTLTWSIIVILLSGIMLYISPPGRYAHWVNWALWGYSKEEWQAIHTLFSFAFVILSVLHLVWINWDTFVSYVKSKNSKGFNKTHELVFSFIVITVIFFGTVFSVPPFKSVMDLGEHYTASWEKVEERAPVPHAELLTLVELSEQLNLSSVDEITKKLDNHKIKYENVSKQTLQQLGEANSLTPIEVYEIISKKAGNLQQGSGIGRKTLEDFAKDAGKSTDEAINILKDNNIKAEKSQTLRVIAENNNITPKEIFELISE